MPGDELSSDGASRERLGEELSQGLSYTPYHVDYPSQQDVDQSVKGSGFGPSNWRLAVTPGTIGVHHQQPRSVIAKPLTKTPSTRGNITEFSSKARLRMIRRLASLDYTPWVDSFQARLDCGNGDLDLPLPVGVAGSDCCGFDCAPSGIPTPTRTSDRPCLCDYSPGVSKTRRASLALHDAAAPDDRRRRDHRVDLPCLVFGGWKWEPSTPSGWNRSRLVPRCTIGRSGTGGSVLRWLLSWPRFSRQGLSRPATGTVDRGRQRRAVLVGVATQAS